MMNFIERALADRVQMSADDFLQAMADIYQEPEVWGVLSEYPQFVRDVIFIIDYDTELQMNGLEGFFANSGGEHFEETKQALQNCGAVGELRILEKAVLIDPEQEASSGQYEELERETALYNDYEEFWELVRNYIEREKQKQG